MPVNAKRLSLSPPGKINLYFELLGERADGFHEVETVMAPVSICDQLDFRLREQPDLCLTLSGRKQGLPVNQKNLILATLNRVRQMAAEEGRYSLPGLDVRLTKRIPVAAGMGGASSNAATSIIAANELWQLGWSFGKQLDLAATLGSDVPFFLGRQMALCTGRGEYIKPIVADFRLPVLIAQPPVGLSTGEVYARSQVPQSPQSSDSFLNALDSGQARSIGARMFNRLEPFAAEMTDWIERFRYEFSRTNPIGQQMTGSGSCYFGIYPNRKVARKAAGCLSNRLRDVTILLGQTLNCGGVSGF